MSRKDPEKPGINKKNGRKPTAAQPVEPANSSTTAPDSVTPILSERHYIALADNLLDAFFELDKDLRYTYWNPASEKLTGISAGEAVGKSLYQLFPAVKGTEAEKAYLTALKTKHPQHFVNEYRLGDRQFYFDIIAYPTEQGLSVYARDITENRQLEEALYQSNEKYSTLVEKSNDGIIIIRDGLLQFVNGKMIEMTGYSREEAIGKPFLDFVTPEFKSLVGDRYRRRTKAGDAVPDRYEAEILDKTGTKIPVEINASLIEHEGKPAVMAIIRDNTKRKRFEKELAESEIKYRSMVENSHDAILLTTPDGGIVAANPAACRLFARTEEVICRIGRTGVMDSTDPRLEAALERRRRTGEFKGEITFLRADGTRFTGEMTSRVFRDSDGNARTSMIIRDMTERQQAEEALRQSEERYRNLFDNTGDLIQSVAPDGRFLYTNNAWRKTLGYSEEEISKLNIWDIIHPDSLNHCQETFRKVVSGERVNDIEAVFVTKEGNPVVVEGNATCKSVDGKPLSTQGIFRDVTERKQALDKLSQSEYRFRELFNNISSCVAVYEAIDNGRDFVFIDFNRAAEKVEGVKREEAVGRKVTEVFPGVIEFGLFDVFRRVWQTGKFEHYPVSQYRDQRIVGWRENYVYKLPDGKIVAVYEDVTERKQAEEALRESGKNFRNSLETSPLAVRIADEEDITLYVNRTLLDTLGYATYEEMESIPIEARYTPESYAAHQERVAKRNRGDPVSLSYEVDIVRRDGAIRHLMASRGEVVWNGKRQVQVLYQDITERRVMEQELADEATRRRLLMEQSRDGIVVFDQDGVVIESNQRFADMLGYTVAEIRRLHVWDWDAQKSREQILAMIRNVDEKGVFFETKHLRKDGSVYDAEISSNGAMFGGRKLVFSICRDITERKQAANELEIERNRLETVTSNVGVGLALISRDFHTVWANNVIKSIFGETIGKPCYSTYNKQAAICPWCGVKRVFLYNEERVETEAHGFDTNGKEVWSQIIATPVRNENGEITGALEVVIPITEHKQVEKALRASEERWQFALEGAGDGVWDWNVQTNEVFFSRRWKEMLGFAEDEIGNTLDELDRRVHPDERVRVNIEVEEYLSGRMPTYSSEHRMLCKDGSYKWVLDRGQVIIHDKNGMPLRFIGTHADITSLKQTQDYLTRSNRALKLISACNEALVRANDEPTLLSVICRLIVTLGDYRMAWVGFVQDDAEKTVLPAAQAGQDAGYLRTVKVTWGDTASGHGPTGTAIRTGRPDVIRNIGDEPRFDFWREEALECSYASALSLPLADRGKVFGALSIYAGEPGAFSPEDIDLLTELANDLAFGVLTLRLQAEHQRTVENLAASEQKYRTLFETAAEGILITEAITKKVRYVNPAICNMLGYSPEELARMSLTDIHPAESRARVFTEFEAHASGEKTISSDIPCLKKDGTILYVDVTSAKALIDGREEIVGFFTDVTQRRLVEQERKETEARLLTAMIKTVQLMSKTMELRDPYTAGHQERVTALATAIAREMGLRDTEVEGIRMAAIVHDLGKIYVPSEILSKPGRLSDLEFSLVKIHAQAGYDILKNVEFPWPIANMILQHHERMDGSGYPHGLSGQDILPGARILAVADVVEAMASHRPYRAALGKGKALEEITAHKGSLYDADTVDACLKLFEKGFEFENKP